MLLSFRFSNFRSFRDEQELSLIAGINPDGREVFSIPGIKESVLPACAIYGANASGKSNLLKALRYVENAVLNSHRHWEPEGTIPLQIFKGTSAEKEAAFSIDFVVGEVRFQFGFKANGTEIAEESLYSYPNGRRQVLYSRTGPGPATISAGRALSGDNKTIAALTRKNSLFLSAAAQNNHEMLLPVYGWFQKSVHFVLGQEHSGALQTARMCRNEDRRREVSDLMTFADLGIVSLQLEKTQADVNEKFRSAFDAFLNVLEFPQDERARLATREDNDRVRLVHRLGDDLVPFDLDDESQGTIAYFSTLGPVLRALDRGSVLVVDELDSSLHPSLTAFLVRLFGDKTSNPKSAQLIFNTHDTQLLADGILGRDQIWFTDKDRQGASRLYPLTDFKPRSEEDFQKRYLQGRFGAIPFINSERIIEGLNARPQ